MKWSFFGEISFLTCQWNLTWSWSMSQSPVMTIRFSILVSDRPPFNVWKKYNINNKPLMLWAVESFFKRKWKLQSSWSQLFDVCVCVCSRTLVMCVVVVVHRDSEVIVWAVINTPGSPSPLPSNYYRGQKEIICVNPHWSSFHTLNGNNQEQQHFGKLNITICFYDRITLFYTLILQTQNKPWIWHTNTHT